MSGRTLFGQMSWHRIISEVYGSSELGIDGFTRVYGSEFESQYRINNLIRSQINVGIVSASFNCIKIGAV